MTPAALSRSAAESLKAIRRDHAARRERWFELHLKLWSLCDYSTELAVLVLPLLADHPIPDIRAGALYGLIEAKVALKHIGSFRSAARDSHDIVRDAGIWGLSQSPYTVDEKTLWKALWEDPVLEIRFSAAYALRVMPRRISSSSFKQALDAHPVYGVKLELAERGIKERRLRAPAQSAMRELLPKLKESRLLTPEVRVVLSRLGVVGTK
ncbi:MAG: hypothetical protein IPM64_00820 [Phycisphaerales bacterium]|nr:hypothetical protein [Phycisphaerales bacterium]